MKYHFVILYEKSKLHLKNMNGIIYYVHYTTGALYSPEET